MVPASPITRGEQGKLLLQLASQWGREVLHIFDQGFASSFWLGLLLAFNLRFVQRRKKEYQLLDAQGQRRAAWKIARGKRGWQERTIWDCRRHLWVQASILALPVRHPDHGEQPLWLVIARRRGGLPWYLLTNEPISSAEEAWSIMFAYARRWQIEVTWRENKSELADHQPAPLGLGAAGETAAVGHPGLRLSADPALSLLRAVTALAAASLLPSHRAAVPPGASAFCTPAAGSLTTLAGLSPALAPARCSRACSGHSHASLSRACGRVLWMKPHQEQGAPGRGGVCSCSCGTSRETVMALENGSKGRARFASENPWTVFGWLAHVLGVLLLAPVSLGNLFFRAQRSN